MQNHEPTTELRNYVEILKKADTSKGANLTINSHGEYGILTMDEIDKLDCYRSTYTLFSKLQRAEERAFKEGWIDADDLERELDIEFVS